MSSDYERFINARLQDTGGDGIAPHVMPDHLFDFQKDLVEWALRRGRAAIFADCGMGKTPMELAWAENVHRETGKPVLLLTPLAVSFQIVQEAEKFGHNAAISRNGRPAAPITVTNYEQVTKFNPDEFGGVVCDESSILKSFDGTRKKEVTEFMRRHRFRMLGTATAAPNDYTELGTSAEALGELGYMDMLTRYFTNKDGSTSSRGKQLGGEAIKWRFKGHAEEPFWKWVSSWARAIRKPSDYGYDDGDFVLPPLVERSIIVEASSPAEGALFDVPAYTMQEHREETRRTLPERVERAASILEHVESGVAWCQLNDESAGVARAVPGAVEVTGSDSPEAKEEKLLAFSNGEIRVLVTKPKIGAWGLNWQHCHNMTYFPSFSYEQYYQAIRRSWRFGQTKPVEVDVITSIGGETMLTSLQRKTRQAGEMFDRLIEHMNNAVTVERARDYNKEIEVPTWLAS